MKVLRQEGQLLRQRTSERLESIAREIGRNIESEFQQWNETVRGAANEATLIKSSFPEIIQQAFDQPGGGVLLSNSGKKLEAFPSHALLYALSSIPAFQTLSDRYPTDIVAAESLEIEKKDYESAIRAYRNLLDSVDINFRPMLIQRLARTLHKAKKLDEAADTYRELLSLDTIWIGGLPSDLLAQTELCSLAAERGDMEELATLAFALYRELVEGKWLLEKQRYLYYSDCCRSWCQESQVMPDDFNQIQIKEKRKLALSNAAEELLNEPRNVFIDNTDIHISFWYSNPLTEIVLSENFLRSQWWPRIISAKGEDIDVALYSSDGQSLFGIPPTETPPFSMMQDIRIDEMPWRIQVWSNNPSAIYADMRQKQNLSLVILVFVVMLLVFGSFITVRIVRRELEFSKMQANFVSTVSHEFRSPLTGIRHLGEMLLDGRATDRKKQQLYFKMIVQESDRLTRLVENILDFSRMEEGRREYRFELMNTSQWLNKLVSNFTTEITAEKVLVETDISQGLPSIFGDQEALSTAIHNLLDNAVKYSYGESSVWLKAEAAGSEVRISVRDTGAGISERDQKHIFDRFYRARGEISRRVKGAGLGLSLVRHIVNAQGGKVECESQVGEGSTFIISLPTGLITEGGKDE